MSAQTWRQPDKVSRKIRARARKSESERENDKVAKGGKKPDTKREIGRNFKTKARVIAIAKQTDINLSHLPHTIPSVFVLSVYSRTHRATEKQTIDN